MRINNFVNLCKELNHNLSFSRLGMVFQTKNNMYFYDAGTGKIFRCGEKEYLLLKNLLSNNDFADESFSDDDFGSAADNIANLIQTEYILSMPQYSEFRHISKTEMLDRINNAKRQLVLEVTENCNLRCKYCIYSDNNTNFRNYSFKNMSIEVAKKSIDYNMKHCGNETTIAFYGGEPLLQYDLIKECINYTEEKYGRNKNISYAFTSNLVLMDTEKATFFSNIASDVSIVCSLDGPKPIHDENRVYLNQNGSFEDTMKGLSCLVKEFSNKAGKYVSIHSVVSPPYSVEKLNEINNFFDNDMLFSKNLNYTYAYVTKDYFSKENSSAYINGIGSEDSDELKYDPIRKWMVKNISNTSNNKSYVNYLAKLSISQAQVRNIFNKPLKVISEGGCCLPGEKKIYVTVDGDFKVCERIGNTQKIGTVENGLDFDAIYKFYIEEFDRKNKNTCSNCWLVHNCSVCYAQCMNSKGIDIDVQNKACSDARRIFKNQMIEYYEILEENPNFIKTILNEQGYNDL